MRTQRPQRDPRTIHYAIDLINEYGTDLFGFDAEQRTLSLDIEKIREAEGKDDGLSKMVAEEPDKAMYNIQCAVEEHPDLDIDDERGVDIVAVKNAPKRTVGDVKAEDFQTARNLTVDITELSSQYAQLMLADFQCLYCNHKTRMVQDPMTDEIDEPHHCPNDDCGRSNFGQIPIQHADSQSAIVQDLPEASLNPQEMEARFFGEDVNQFDAGDRVHLTVIVRTQSDDKSSREYPILEVLHAEKEEEKASVELEEDEIESFEETADEEDMLELLLESYAPHLEGEEIKAAREGMLLTLFSGDLGVSDGVRDTIHTAHIGDPSTGKSDLLEEARKVAPHHAFASGLNASKAGVSAGLERQSKLESEDWTLKAGTMVRANDGVALIDELDKLGDSAVRSLYDPLARQTVKIDKIISKELKANPATAIASNPKNERFNLDNPIGEQLNYPPALLSRFDLIFTVLDSNEADELKADAMTQKFMAVSTDGSGFETPFTNEEMRKIIYYARNNYQPTITSEAAEYLKGKWTELRDSMEAQAGVSIDTRQYESLLTIALTYARIRLSEEAEIQDAERAWNITRKSFSDINRFGDNDTFDVTMLYAGESTSQAERREDVLSKIRELDEGENTYANEELVADALSEKYEADEVKAEIELLKEKGKVFPMSGELKVSDQSQ
ncbi:minichromosome maintenance protein MCM [Halorubrum vacuolatum]|uniref:DNA helicase n=1 Tax=Halorubrum vacuolatum TaxID=63740 RepID=A0A238WT22_HALVU|nr:minichromosome maintenance protein MCM [Halorubrum vacuolatum]SNR49697.1 replicative DNA helicase Mcm [Halorubrum vacuolatum]